MRAVAARRLLFWVLSGALVGSAAFIFLGVDRGSGGSSDATAPVPIRSARIYGVETSSSDGAEASRPPVGAVSVGLRRPARRFVSAYLRYEVGDRAPWVLRAVRSGATAPFRSQLLAAPVGEVAAGPPRAAEVRTLAVRAVSGKPPVALVSGEAHRPGGIEQFSFLFVRTRAGWRAFGPGE